MGESLATRRRSHYWSTWMNQCCTGIRKSPVENVQPALRPICPRTGYLSDEHLLPVVPKTQGEVREGPQEPLIHMRRAAGGQSWWCWAEDVIPQYGRR